jgi:hypothetical protein
MGTVITESSRGLVERAAGVDAYRSAPSQFAVTMGDPRRPALAFYAAAML